jgi:hypothetical protein
VCVINDAFLAGLSRVRPRSSPYRHGLYERFGNARSLPHQPGQEAKDALDD